MEVELGDNIKKYFYDKLIPQEEICIDKSKVIMMTEGIDFGIDEIGVSIKLYKLFKNDKHLSEDDKYILSIYDDRINRSDDEPSYQQFIGNWNQIFGKDKDGFSQLAAIDRYMYKFKLNRTTYRREYEFILNKNVILDNDIKLKNIVDELKDMISKFVDISKVNRVFVEPKITMIVMKYSKNKYLYNVSVKLYIYPIILILVKLNK